MILGTLSLTLFILASPGSPQSTRRSELLTKRLVVMVQSCPDTGVRPLDCPNEDLNSGAGLLLGLGEDSAYIATPEHVVDTHTPKTYVQVLFPSATQDETPSKYEATVLSRIPLDALAENHTVPRPLTHDERIAKPVMDRDKHIVILKIQLRAVTRMRLVHMDFDRVADRRSLVFADPVFIIGHDVRQAKPTWHVSLTQNKLQSESDESDIILAATPDGNCHGGDSGGVITDENWNIIGMIFGFKSADSATTWCVALGMDRILSQIKSFDETIPISIQVSPYTPEFSRFAFSLLAGPGFAVNGLKFGLNLQGSVGFNITNNVAFVLALGLNAADIGAPVARGGLGLRVRKPESFALSVALGSGIIIEYTKSISGSFQLGGGLEFPFGGLDSSGPGVNLWFGIGVGDW